MSTLLIVPKKGTYTDAQPARVSVIIPTYNRADALVLAVESCLAQTHAVHEVLVCDDGSTDGSEQRIAQLCEPQVKWTAGTRAGRPAVPRNRGIAAATGEWIAFLDDDDSWMPEKIATQLSRCAKNKVDASCTNAECIDPIKGSKGNYFNTPSTTITFKELLAVNKVICSSMLVKKDVLMSTGGFPEGQELKASEDYALWLRVALKTSITYCAEPLLRYNDAATATLRASVTDVAQQRETILRNLYQWECENAGMVDRAQRWATASHLRAAMRAAGKPLWDRLFIR